MSGLFSSLTEFLVPVFMFFIVRKYVEGMKDSTQLLDLLAAVGSEDMEPTRAAAGRQVLYPDVSIFPLALRRFQPLKQGSCTKNTLMRTSIIISKEVYRCWRLLRKPLLLVLG